MIKQLQKSIIRHLRTLTGAWPGDDEQANNTGLRTHHRIMPPEAPEAAVGETKALFSHAPAQTTPHYCVCRPPDFG